jgi:hypothetical protein
MRTPTFAHEESIAPVAPDRAERWSSAMGRDATGAPECESAAGRTGAPASPVFRHTLDLSARAHRSGRAGSTSTVTKLCRSAVASSEARRRSRRIWIFGCGCGGARPRTRHSQKLCHPDFFLQPRYPEFAAARELPAATAARSGRARQNFADLRNCATTIAEIDDRARSRSPCNIARLPKGTAPVGVRRRSVIVL